MFPDTRPEDSKLTHKGKVFRTRVVPTGGLAGPDRDVEFDVNEWDDCQRCEEFASCYKLCLAKVAIEAAF